MVTDVTQFNEGYIKTANNGGKDELQIKVHNKTEMDDVLYRLSKCQEGTTTVKVGLVNPDGSTSVFRFDHPIDYSQEFNIYLYRFVRPENFKYSK